MNATPAQGLLPLVSVVGRPNAGKSTLFNRLTRTRAAIVDAVAGITRDRREGSVEWCGKWFRLADTGGLGLDDAQGFGARIEEQARAAIALSRIVVLLVDARAGLSPLDVDAARLLRRAGADVIVAANKIDQPGSAPLAAEFHALGPWPVVALSAEQGYGVDALLDVVVLRLGAAAGAEPAADEATRVAVIGRPNVGKSSLVNRLLGEERVIVSEVPGTTRDAIDVRVEIDGQAFVLVDTAGLRRKGTDAKRVEHVARVQAERAVGRADVALLLLDAVEGPTHQDAVVAGMAAKAGAAIIVLANKWDLVTDQEAAHPRLVAAVREGLRFAPWAPVHAVSVRTGERLHRIAPEVARVAANRRRRVGTAELNQVMEEAMARHQPPQRGSGRSFRAKYMSQVGVAPPTFVAFCSGGRAHFSWQRYLENRLREAFDLDGTPIVLKFRSSARRT